MIVESFRGVKYNFAKEVTRMKKFFVLVTFLVAVMISSTALAANWIQVDSTENEYVNMITSVDKDSIKRGIQSEKLDFSCADGFTACVKFRIEPKDGHKPFAFIVQVGFFEENGVKKRLTLAGFNENGELLKSSPDKVEILNVEGTQETFWPSVWNFVEKNLP